MGYSNANKNINFYESINLITSSLLIPRKGLIQIIRTLKFDKRLKYICLGDGPEKNNLIQEIKKYNVSSQVTMKGFVNDPGVYYKISDIFLITSYSEGVPIALLEALSIGLPVVCPNINIFKEICNLDYAEYFELDNNKSLYQAIIKIVQNYNIKSINARKEFENKYSNIIMANNYKKLYYSMDSVLDKT
jgi:glycosyltransferase involved in cell wall biosynthesis